MNKFDQRDFDLFRKSQGISGIAMHDYQKHAVKNYMSQTQHPNIIANNKGIITSEATLPIGGYISPTIIEERQLNIASMDVFSRMMMDRIIFLGSGIDDNVGNIITSQLLYLDSVDNTKDIEMYINSGGGGVYSGLAIFDTMNFIKSDVNTMVCGLAASMAYVLAINGKKRSALRHSRLMQHQPLSGVSGQASDIEITAREVQKLKVELYEIISEKTGQPYDKVYSDCDRDFWMSAIESKEYGAIDKVIGMD